MPLPSALKNYSTEWLERMERDKSLSPVEWNAIVAELALRTPAGGVSSKQPPRPQLESGFSVVGFLALVSFFALVVVGYRQFASPSAHPEPGALPGPMAAASAVAVDEFECPGAPGLDAEGCAERSERNEAEYQRVLPLAMRGVPGDEAALAERVYNDDFAPYYNRILGCAWMMVFIASGDMSIREPDVREKDEMCAAIGLSGIGAASAQAERIQRQIGP